MQGIKIQFLSKPNRKCGYPLAAGATTKRSGVTIINTTNKVAHIDVFTRNYKKSRKKK